MPTTSKDLRTKIENATEIIQDIIYWLEESDEIIDDEQIAIKRLNNVINDLGDVFYMIPLGKIYND